MVALDRLHGDRMGRRGQAAIGLQAQALHVIVEQFVPAFLGGEHQGEAAVARDIHGLHRVHLYGDF